eukprot:313180-Chlamydomonas_euryale.AAC.4
MSKEHGGPGIGSTTPRVPRVYPYSTPLADDLSTPRVGTARTRANLAFDTRYAAGTNIQTGEEVAIKLVCCLRLERALPRLVSEPVRLRCFH